MKVWYGFGSDHSANLVMIGEFKTEQDAERVYELISTISDSASSDSASGVFDWGAQNEQFSEETEKRLRELKIYYMSPSDIADFAFLNTSIEKAGKQLQFRTDDVEIVGFVKLMVKNGAKVQVFSAYDYPDDKNLTNDE
ncbi:MAG: hypothetical protein JNK90_30165 [Planctomycetaceae bacterium]|nr:hypothetical protein [Planctomycetaceae bacterium]